MVSTAQLIRKKKRKARRQAESAKFRSLNIRIEDIDYKNIALLQRLVSAQGKILSRKRTGLNAHAQRKLTRAIKRARFLALMPFVG